LPLWFPGWQGGCRLLTGLVAFPLPRTAMGEEAARHSTERVWGGWKGEWDELTAQAGKTEASGAEKNV
jgi:hypothetical protein